MNKFTLLTGIISFALANAHATSGRIPEFSNQHVKVWETVIFPGKSDKLSMHRHEHDRVLIALSDGILRVTNNKGQSHDLRLEKDKAYYLRSDVPNELHTDENVSPHPVKVMLIELL